MTGIIQSLFIIIFTHCVIPTYRNTFPSALKSDYCMQFIDYFNPYKNILQQAVDKM